MVVGGGVVGDSDHDEGPSLALPGHLPVEVAERRRLAVSDIITERSSAQAYARSGSIAMCGGGTSESANLDRRAALRLSRRGCSRTAYSCAIMALRDDDEDVSRGQAEGRAHPDHLRRKQ